MSIKVERDGVIIHLGRDVQKVDNREIAITTSRVCEAGNKFPDDQVAEHIIEMARGDSPLFSYVDDDAVVPDEDQVSQTSQGGEGGEDAPYDPSEHNVDEVLAYLATAGDDEIKRVKVVEASGHKRAKIRGYEKAPTE